jgi:hypothetical protein
LVDAPAQKKKPDKEAPKRRGAVKELVFTNVRMFVSPLDGGERLPMPT